MDQIIYYALQAIAVLIVADVFNFIKVLMSTLQGDNLPKAQGTLSLNPVKSFEAVGFILFLFFGYGWSKPVETSSRNYKNKKSGILITNIVPIAACIFISVLLRFAMNVVIISYANLAYLPLAIALLSKAFAAIGVFNIIPVYPMAGSYILRCVLNPNQAIKYGQYEKIIQTIIIFLLILGVITPVLDFVVALICG